MFYFRIMFPPVPVVLSFKWYISVPSFAFIFVFPP